MSAERDLRREEEKPSAPRKLLKTDHVSGFESGAEELDDWLTKHAWVNQRANNAVVYVSTVDEGRVIGYYAITVAGVSKQIASERIAGRSGPKDVPCLLLARLAVDYSMQGKKIGRGLLADVFKRAVDLHEVVGMKALLVHARDEAAKNFYLAQAEFISSPTDELHLMITIEDIVAMLRGKRG